jgi:hypothetical protein
MHLHLPKPIHGWRQFAGEVGIIVLGVLIALAAEQAIQKVRDRSIAAETKQAVTQEIDTNLAALYLRGTAEPCISRRLDELRKIFADWQASGTFKTPLWVAQAPSVTMQLTRYETALSAGRLALLPSEDQYDIGATVVGLRAADELTKEELSVWGRLRALQAGPAALSGQDEAQLRVALQDAATLDYRVRLQENQVLPEAAKYGFHPDFTRFHQIAAMTWKSGRFTPSICVEINVPPGQANEQSGQVTPLSL